MADEIKDPNTVSSEEMAALIRGDIADPRDKRPEAAEPEVQVEGEGAVDTSRPVSKDSSQPDEAARVPEGDERQRLLSTIENMERQHAQLRSEMETLRQQQRREAPAEPQVETVEYFPGVRLPRDQSLLPVNLTPEHLKNIGIEPSPELARGLSILGSALLIRMQSVMQPYVDERYNTLSNMRENASRGTASFFDAYPDLAGQDDFIALVEQGARERDHIHQIYRGEAYTREVAKRVRTRIAAMRGQSLQDYENALDNTQSTRRPASRATTTPTRRGGAAPPRGGEQSEIDAVIDGR